MLGQAGTRFKRTQAGVCSIKDFIELIVIEGVFKDSRVFDRWCCDAIQRGQMNMQYSPNFVDYFSVSLAGMASMNDTFGNSAVKVCTSIMDKAITTVLGSSLVMNIGND